MNTETGQVYRGSEVEAAVLAGIPVVPISERIARALEDNIRHTGKCCPGHLESYNRATRRVADRDCKCRGCRL